MTMTELAKTDRSGNPIGEGGWNKEPNIYDFSVYPQVSHTVSKSETSESTYVKYVNNDNDKSITVRFSDHENNAVKFGDQLNGYWAFPNEILAHLGLKNRVFVPDTYLYIPNRKVGKKTIANYEVADKTISEMYALGKDGDLSQYVGKIAKDSNYLIFGEKVEEVEKTKLNCFGNSVAIGSYNYYDI